MKIEDIVKPFFCTNYSRPLFTGIMYDGRYGYATDSHCCIRWEDQEQKPMDKLPDFYSIYNKETDTDFIFEITPFIEWQHSLDKVPDYAECTYCEGCGEVQWQFENFTKYDECPHCDGEGRYENHNLLVPVRNIMYELNGRKFKQKYIENVIHVMNCFDLKSCYGRYKSDNNKMAFSFYVDKFDILVMPTTVS